MDEGPRATKEDWAKGRAALTVCVRGEKVEAGAILAQHLETVLHSVRLSLERLAQRSTEERKVLRAGPRTALVRSQASLFFTSFQKGSAVMRLELRPGQLQLTGQPTGAEIVTEWMEGTAALHDLSRALPQSYDHGVLSGIKLLDPLFSQGVDEVEFSWEVGGRTTRAKYDVPASHRATSLMQRPSVKNRRTESGIILEADFRSPKVTFTIQSDDDRLIHCTASDEDLGIVLEGLMHSAHVSGDATVDPETGKTKALDVDSIEIDQSSGLLDIPHENVRDFWIGVELDELIRRRDVPLIEDSKGPTWTPPSDEEWERYVAAMGWKSRQRLPEGG